MKVQILFLIVMGLLISGCTSAETICKDDPDFQACVWNVKNQRGQQLMQWNNIMNSSAPVRIQTTCITYPGNVTYCR